MATIDRYVEFTSSRSQACKDGIAMLPIEQLEAYTVDRPNEVLLVNATIEGEADEIVVFRGYSSSTVRPTAADLNVPVLPDDGEIISVSRLKAPYNPQSPHVIEANISWNEFWERYLQ